jgi:hypothetical protein
MLMKQKKGTATNSPLWVGFEREKGVRGMFFEM